MKKIEVFTEEDGVWIVESEGVKRMLDFVHAASSLLQCAIEGIKEEDGMDISETIYSELFAFLVQLKKGSTDVLRLGGEFH